MKFVYNSSLIGGFVFYLITLLSGICECPNDVKQKVRGGKLSEEKSRLPMFYVCMV